MLCSKIVPKSTANDKEVEVKDLGLIMAAERPAVADSERCGWKSPARSLSLLRETPMSSIDAAAAAATGCIDVVERPRSKPPEVGVLPSSSRSFLCCSLSRSFACARGPYNNNSYNYLGYPQRDYQ